MPLQCTDYAPSETHQEQPSAYANTTGKPLSSSCHWKQFYYHVSASLFVQKSGWKRNKISPSYFLEVFSKLVHSWSKVFLRWVWPVCLSPGTVLPLEQQFIIPTNNSVICVIPNQSLHVSKCICKILPTLPGTHHYAIPDMSYFDLHWFFWYNHCQ